MTKFQPPPIHWGANAAQARQMAPPPSHAPGAAVQPAMRQTHARGPESRLPSGGPQRIGPPQQYVRGMPPPPPTAPFRSGPAAAIQPMYPRPNFHPKVYEFAVIAHNTFQEDDLDETDPELTSLNAAVPHRMPWADLRESVKLFVSGAENKQDLERWTDRFIEAAGEDIGIFQNLIVDYTNQITHGKIQKSEKQHLEDVVSNLGRTVTYIQLSTATLLAHRKNLTSAKTNAAKVAAANQFLKTLNSYFPNVPDLGPHRGVNIQVSDRGHLNVVDGRSLSPMSRRVLAMSPHRLRKGIATTKSDEVVTTFGETIPFSSFGKDTQQGINAIGTSQTNASQIPFSNSTGWKP